MLVVLPLDVDVTPNDVLDEIEITNTNVETVDTSSESDPIQPIFNYPTDPNAHCVDGSDDTGIWVCAPDEEPEDDGPTMEEEVHRVSRTIGVPGLSAITSPEHQVFVNVDTVLHTPAQTFARTVTLLGTEVTIEAVPVQFTWHHGDGTTQTTTVAGRPWPAKDVTHRWSHVAEKVELSVDTLHQVRYRVAGGPWIVHPTTLTTTGPVTTLEVRQARPVLVHR